MKASRATRQNVFYSVLDYVSQPAIMLLAAPVLLRTLGAQQYGTWMLVNSIAATASGLGGGFGDGATKYVSMYRGCGDHDGAVRSLLAALLVNSAFGIATALILAASAPWLIGHVFAVQPKLQHVGIVAVRISAALLAVRFAESVFASSIRGCEQYRPLVVISVLARTAATLAAIALALGGRGLVPILWATLAAGTVSLVAQALLARHVLQARLILQWSDVRGGIREIFSFSAFTWLKSSIGVSIGYADRLLVAALLGTGSLAFYSLCNQLTQPMHALMAAAFSFVFPSFSAQTASGRWAETRHRYWIAASTAGLAVLGMSMVLIFGAKLILRTWLGADIATRYHDLLITMAVGNGLLALSVVPHYAALALGRARALVLVNVAAGVLSLASGYFLISRIGLLGAGIAKIVAGVVFLSVYGIVRARLSISETPLRGLPPRNPSSFDFAQ
jgi:O-antigen/teichoic acid export membrane protein